MMSFLLLLVCVVGVSSFRTSSLSRRSIGFSPIFKMSDEMTETDAEPDFIAPADEDKAFFEPNKRVRLGRSRDQDGKSNVWSIEPRMEVEDADEDDEPINVNLKVAGLAIGAAIVSLPIFLSLSKMLPDPSDF